MKYSTLLLALAPVMLHAEIRLTGIADPDGKGPKFVLVDTESKDQANWIGVGSKFGGFILAEFDPKTDTLLLKSESATLKLQVVQTAILDSGPVQPTKPVAQTSDEGKPREDFNSMTDEELLGRGLRRTKPGDTFSKVARNSGLTVKDIMALNPEVNPARLRVGQILRIRGE